MIDLKLAHDGFSCNDVANMFNKADAQSFSAARFDKFRQPAAQPERLPMCGKKSTCPMMLRRDKLREMPECALRPGCPSHNVISVNDIFVHDQTGAWSLDSELHWCMDANIA